MICFARRVGTVTRMNVYAYRLPALWVYAQLICAGDLFMSIAFVKCNQFHILPSLYVVKIVDGTTTPKEGVVSSTRLLFDYTVTL
jgi:hypothetical protein